MDPKKFGQVFQNLIENKNVSPEQVSLDLNMPLSTLQKIQKGEYLPQEKDIKIICDYFNISWENVFNPKLNIDLLDSKMDPKEVGERIRHYRTQKKLSLRDLSRHNVFSLGKLSNIENGNVPVNIKDIETICNFLEIPIDKIIDPKRNEKIESLKLNIKRARVYISLGLFDCAKKLLIQSTDEITKNQFPELEFYNNYVWGLYFLSQKVYEHAEIHLEHSLNFDNHNEETNRIKLQILNALTFMTFEQGKLNQSMRHGNKAIRLINETTDQLDIEDISIAFFNFAIVTCHLGHLDSSIFYIQKALDLSEGILKHQIMLLKAIILSLRGEYFDALNLTRKSVDSFIRDNDVHGIMKALQLKYYLTKYSIRDEDKEGFADLIENNVPQEILLANKFKPEQKLELFQVVIRLGIKEKDDELVEKFLNKCFEMEVLHPKIKDHFKTNYLAFYYFKNKNINKSRLTKYLEKAKHYLEKDNESVYKALVLYELSALTNEKYSNNPLLVESSRILIERFLHEQCNDFEIIKHLIPKPQYG